MESQPAARSLWDSLGSVEPRALTEFCRRHHISQMSLFGSILRDELTPASDLDFLVRFEEGHAPGFLGLARMQRELSGLLGGREADLRTAEDLSPYFRDEVLSEAVPLYAAE